MNPQERKAAAPLLQVQGLVKSYPVRGASPFRGGKEPVHAVAGVSFDLERGETLGLVGESGCGKSTLARCLLRLTDPTAGSIRFNGTELAGLSQARLRPLRRRMQLVFQDPYGSLNPRRRVGSILSDPFRIHGEASGRDLTDKVRDLLGLVGLDPDHASRFPAEFSGGQRQRIGIARAIALRPDLVVCDEPVSALDVSVQAQILNLLQDLQASLGMAYLFISHDLSVVRHVSDRVAVMYLGRIVETATAEALFHHPRHPYTRALMSAIPGLDAEGAKERIVLAGEPPSPGLPPSGCRFHPRCPRASALCSMEEPPLRNGSAKDGSHWTACHDPMAEPVAAVQAQGGAR